MSLAWSLILVWIVVHLLLNGYAMYYTAKIGKDWGDYAFEWFADMPAPIGLLMFLLWPIGLPVITFYHLATWLGKRAHKRASQPKIKVPEARVVK